MPWRAIRSPLRKRSPVRQSNLDSSRGHGLGPTAGQVGARVAQKTSRWRSFGASSLAVVLTLWPRLEAGVQGAERAGEQAVPSCAHPQDTSTFEHRGCEGHSASQRHGAGKRGLRLFNLLTVTSGQKKKHRPDRFHTHLSTALSSAPGSSSSSPFPGTRVPRAP